MSAIYKITNPWRTILLSEQASFNGIPFHVETGARLSGRRNVTHEYPKRNEPYSEDMGRHARRFQFTGYLVYKPNPQGPAGPANAPVPNIYFEYTQNRDALQQALETDDAGWLVHPVFCRGGMFVVCERYSMVETRQRGGYTEFEMQFVEAGTPGNSVVAKDTRVAVSNAAAAVDNAATNNLSKVSTAIGTPYSGSWPAPSPSPYSASPYVIG